jgi:hypothetical protein
VDLFGEFDDQAIWDVLSKMNMHKVIAGLDGKVRKRLSVREVLAYGILFYEDNCFHWAATHGLKLYSP